MLRLVHPCLHRLFFLFGLLSLLAYLYLYISCTLHFFKICSVVCLLIVIILSCSFKAVSVLLTLLWLTVTVCSDVTVELSPLRDSLDFFLFFIFYSHYTIVFHCNFNASSQFSHTHTDTCAIVLYRGHLFFFFNQFICLNILFLDRNWIQKAKQR